MGGQPRHGICCSYVQTRPCMPTSLAPFGSSASTLSPSSRPFGNTAEIRVVDLDENETIFPAGNKVLLLEDDPAFREIMTDFLQENSYEVTAVQNSIEGVHKVLASDFELILCDMMMPTLPGDMFFRAVDDASAPLRALRFHDRPAAWSRSSTHSRRGRCSNDGTIPRIGARVSCTSLPEGRELLGQAVELAGGFESDLCAELDDAEREQLLELLQRVGARLGLEPPVHPAARPSGSRRRVATAMAGAGFEPAKAEPTRLQRVPFDRSGTPPGA